MIGKPVCGLEVGMHALSREVLVRGNSAPKTMISNQCVISTIDENGWLKTGFFVDAHDSITADQPWADMIHPFSPTIIYKAGLMLLPEAIEVAIRSFISEEYPNASYRVTCFPCPHAEMGQLVGIALTCLDEGGTLPEEYPTLSKIIDHCATRLRVRNQWLPECLVIYALNLSEESHSNLARVFGLAHIHGEDPLLVLNHGW